MALTGMQKTDPLYPVMEALDNFYDLIEAVPIELAAERKTISIQLGQLTVLTESFIAVAQDLESKLNTTTPRAFSKNGISRKELAWAVLLALLVGTIFGRPFLGAILSGSCSRLPEVCEVNHE